MYKFLGSICFHFSREDAKGSRIAGFWGNLMSCYFVSVFDSKHPTGVEWYHGDLDLPLLNEFLSIFS